MPNSITPRRGMRNARLRAWHAAGGCLRPPRFRPRRRGLWPYMTSVGSEGLRLSAVFYLLAAFAVVGVWLQSLASSFERLSVLPTPFTLTPDFLSSSSFVRLLSSPSPTSFSSLPTSTPISLVPSLPSPSASPTPFFDEVAAFRDSLTRAAPLLASPSPTLPSFEFQLDFPSQVSSFSPSVVRSSPFLPSAAASPLPFFVPPTPVVVSVPSVSSYAGFFSPPVPFLSTPIAPSFPTPYVVPVTVVVTLVPPTPVDPTATSFPSPTFDASAVIPSPSSVPDDVKADDVEASDGS